MAESVAGQPRVPVVGVGASAGGIKALRAFFEQVPADSGAAYVVILHLPPEHESKLSNILQSVARIPVLKVGGPLRLEQNAAYVASADQQLSLSDGELRVAPKASTEARRAPVDLFFRALAESHGSASVCVILSGTGADGSMGLRLVKANDGVVMVQSPREAEFSEMPRHAIATGFVDEVLPVAEIPARIHDYLRRRRALELEPAPSRDEPEQPEVQRALQDIFDLLAQRTGHEFSSYKRSTLLRRIGRRVSVRKLPDIASYVEHLRENPSEVRLLLKDLLISVTHFFRDKEAFAALEEEVLPRLLDGKGADDVVRVWVVGCATGEEVYSLAMLLRERADELAAPPKIQLFATDIDETALAAAREGTYSLSDVADVSPERLRRFFNKVGDAYRVRREIREMTLFAKHNVLRAPPFSRLDLVTCRNLLIYLDQPAQERVLRTLHFALNPDGFLMLGNSESVDGTSELFTPVDRAHRLFRSRPAPHRQFSAPRAVPALDFEPALPAPAPRTRFSGDRETYGDLHGRLLEAFAPPSLVVDEDYQVVHLSERAGNYLHIAGGEPSSNLLSLVRPELRLELRSALERAVRDGSPVDSKAIGLGNGTSVTLRVRPVLESAAAARGFILVMFEELEGAPTEGDQAAAAEPLAEQLEEELRRAEAELRRSTDQYERQAEELRAANEELQALNEELHSTAEELETSQEELQSINEELRTVNQELKVQIEETTVVSNNLHNLINSTDIGVIFLDRSFRVQLFSPAARALFNLIPADIGRPLADITHRMDYDGLVIDAESVLERLHGIEREVLGHDGRSYLMRVLPYRTSDDQINGAVVTFVDITDRKRAEDARRETEEKMRLVVESAKDFAIFTMDQDRRITSWNVGAEALFGYAEDEVLGELGDLLFTADDRELGVPELEVRTAMAEGRAGGERWHARKGGERFYGSGLVNRLRDREGALVGYVKIMRDLTERKLIEDARRASEAKYRSLFDSIDEGFCILEMINDKTGKSVDYRFLEVNQAFERQTGLVDAAGRTALDLVPDLERKWIEAYGRVAATGKAARFEDSSEQMGRVFDVYASPVESESGRLVALVFRDITERKREEASKAVLAAIGDELNVLEGPQEIMRAAATQVGSHLALATCLFVDVDEGIDQVTVRDGWSPTGSRLTEDQSKRLSEFLDVVSANAQRAGEMIVVSDTADIAPEARSFAGSEAGSAVVVPYHREGRWTASLVVTDESPRAWRDDELALLRDVADRVFPRIERARAEEALQALNESLREQVEERTQAWLNSRERFVQAFEAGPTAAVITSIDEDRIVDANDVFTELTGYGLEEVEGRLASELGLWSSEEDRSTIREALDEDGDGYRHVRLSVRTKAGELREVLLSAQRIVLDSGPAWLKMFLTASQRNRSQEELLVAIDRVMSDTDWFSQQVVERLSQIRSRGPRNQKDADELLSARQIEVLGLIAEGLKDAAIAKQLSLSPKTVRNHIANIYGKIGVSSRLDAVLWARERGFGG